ncbi:MAG: hypothetical protein Q8O82_12105 [Pseudorhodobacter sp.]|nr:hypothetical protein [Pseudorhodobacter sp.]
MDMINFLFRFVQIGEMPGSHGDKHGTYACQALHRNLLQTLRDRGFGDDMSPCALCCLLALMQVWIGKNRWIGAPTGCCVNSDQAAEIRKIDVKTAPCLSA